MDTDMFNHDLCKNEYKTLLTERMNEERALIISGKNCTWSPKTKNLLGQYNIAYSEVVIDDLAPYDMMEIANCIFGKEERYVPFLYLNKKRIGSYGDFYKIHKSGKMKEMGFDMNKPKE